MSLLEQLIGTISKDAPHLISDLQHVGWLNGWINRTAIDASVTCTPARPLSSTLWTGRPIGTPYVGPAPEPTADYVTWAGLFDRRFTGRHLPPASDAFMSGLPPIERVVDLFHRDRFIPSATSSTLLCFFAQWFTDSFLRTDPTDPRLNTSNHEIDLCQIYGLDAETARLLRTLQGGRLRASPDGLFPERLFDDDGAVKPHFAGLAYMRAAADGTDLEDRVLGSLIVPDDERRRRRQGLYATGLERGNSTILYTAISSIFLREHNRICGELAHAYPAWDDDRLFETARNINIVMVLGLVINEYINHLAQSPFHLSLDRSFAEHETWYRTNRIAIEFDLLYRWHPLVPDGFLLDGQALGGNQFRFNNALLEAYGAEALIAAASRQPAGRVGTGNSPRFLRQAEIAAHTLSRSMRLASFTDYQARFGQTPIASYEEMAGDTPLAGTLRDLYGPDVRQVEFMVGLFAQQHDDHAVLPATLMRMVAVDAFSQILTNPLLSANVYGEKAFSRIGLDIIAATHTFQDLIERNRAPGIQRPAYASFDLPPVAQPGLHREARNLENAASVASDA